MDVESLISVIIPVYNSKPFLENCLKSVVTQEYSNWECLLIDDGSTDGGGAICDAWREIDSRFRVFHQDNYGVSAARNRGIEEAEGEFITFIDSDDWVDKFYIKYLLTVYSDHPCEMVVSGTTHVSNKGGTTCFSSSGLHLLDLSIPSPSTTGQFLSNIGLVYGPTAILYNKSVIDSHSIRFPENQSIGEDIVFNFNYLSCIDHVLFCPESHYYYRRHSDSLINAKCPNRFSIHYSNWLCQKSFMLSKGLWNTDAQEHFGRKLWGIVYESLFMSDDRSIQMIRSILSMEDMDLMLSHSDSFNSSPWIKRIVASRNSFLIWGVVNFLKLIK